MLALNSNPLFPFRKDLELLPGPVEDDGSPTYQLFDPLTGQYIQLQWEEYLVWKYFRKGMQAQELAQVIAEKTTTHLLFTDIILFFQQAQKSNLLEWEKPTDKCIAEAKKKLTWLQKISSLLWLPVPLFSPDKFLTKTLPYIKWIFSPGFFFSISQPSL